MDLISVIIPVYKVEDFVEECVQSVVKQTYRNLEIILVDDGSPDCCPALCDAWKSRDSRIKVIHKKNGGLSDARNAGMAAASGKYISFVDSDDWLDSTFLEQMYAALQKNHADIAACSFQKVENSGDAIAYSGSPMVTTYQPEAAIGELISGRTISAVVWNKLFKAELLSGKWFEVGRFHEDEFFTYHILDKAECIVYIDAPLYFYRQRVGSIMTINSMKHLDSLDAYLGRLKLLKKKYPDLYQKDKITFCRTCLRFYANTFSEPWEDLVEARRKIKDYRRQLNLTLADLKGNSLRDFCYIIASSTVCIDFYSRVISKIRK